jgi:O-antigen/teichoic acid export membrane protein
MFIILGSISSYYFWQNNTTLGWGLAIAAVFLPFLQSYGFYNSLLVGQKNFRASTFYNIVTTIIPTILLIIVAGLTRNILAMIATYFLVNTTLAAIIYKQVIKTNLTNQAVDYQALSYGKHLSLMNILGAFSFQLDRVLVFHYFGAAQLAVYSIALGVPQQLRILNKNLSTVVLPKLSTRNLKELQKSLPHKFTVTLIGSLIIVMGYLMIAPLIYNLFFPDYPEAIPYSQFFALIMLFFPVSLYQQTLTAHAKTMELYLVQIVSPLIKIIAMLVLTPYFGIYGVISSMFVYEIIRLILVVYFVHRHHGSNKIDQSIAENTVGEDATFGQSSR